MRRLASQPRSVRYGIPRRMRAQHRTTMTVRPEIEPWHEATTINNQQSINKQNNKSRSPGAEFQKEFKKFKFKLNLIKFKLK